MLDDMSSRFAAQSMQLAQSAQDWSTLKAAASNGQLRMEPGVAERAAARCEEMVRTLDGRITDARQLIIQGGMGDCIIGNTLNATFNNKATGDTNSLTAVLLQHQAILTDLAATYRAAGSCLTTQEQGNADALGAP